MTNEEVKAKADELSKQHSVKVHPLLFKVGKNEQVVGFIKEPPRFVKLRIMDKALISPVSAASEIVDAYLIKEESDARIYDEKSENDMYYIGAAMEAYNLIQVAVNQLKKN